MKVKLLLLTTVVSVALVFALSMGVALAQDVTVSLDPSPGQTASGTAMLTAVTPAATRVDVTVSGLAPNASITNHIHAGSCASPGGTPHFLLPNLVTDAQGNASTSTVLNASLADLAGLIIISPHVGEGGTPTICGAVPAVSAAPAPVADSPAPAATAETTTPAASADTATTTETPAPVVAGVTALPASGGFPAPFVPTALLGMLAAAIGLYLRRR